MQRANIVAWLLLLLAPLQSFAATGATMSGTGSTVVDEAKLNKERARRSEGLHDAEIAFQTIDTQFREKLAVFYKKRAENRRQCRDDIRRANRDTLLKTILRCYKTELGLEADLLKNRSEYLTALPGLTKPVRTTVLNRLNLLQDAVDTIAFGIDSGVYNSQDTLGEVRENLRLKYRIPFWDALITARADRALTWAGSLILGIDAAAAEEKKITGKDNDSWTGARLCLATQETALQDILDSTAVTRGDDLSKAQSDIQTCLSLLKTIPNMTGTGSTMH